MRLLPVASRVGFASLCLLSATGLSAASPNDLQPGWGANFHWYHGRDDAALEAQLKSLETGDLSYALVPLWTRLDAHGLYRPELRPRLERFREAGYQVVVPVMHPPSAGGARLTGETAFLQDNLLEVFQAAKRLAYDHRGLVDVYFGPNEPDLSSRLDLPDRVTSYHQALYLGLKAGAGESGPYLRADRGFRADDLGSVAVLMPPLATGISPWSDEAARNGLFAYQDGLNLHYYGWESSLEDFVADARYAFDLYRAGAPVLPEQPAVWLTEINTLHLIGQASNDPWFRREQARFFALTAHHAVRAGVEVFIPFALKWGDNPHFDLYASPTEAQPAGSAFQKMSRDLTLGKPGAQAVKQPASIHPVVAQWLPAPGTMWPSKAHLAYRFLPEGQRPDAEALAASPVAWAPEFGGVPGLIFGELRLYNFSEAPVRGFVEWEQAGSHRALLGPPVVDEVSPLLPTPLGFGQTGRTDLLELPPMGLVRLPLAFSPDAGALRAGRFSAHFVTLNGVEAPAGQEPPEPVVSFALETLPVAGALQAIPITVAGTTAPLRFPEQWVRPPEAPWPTPRAFNADRWPGVPDLAALRTAPLPPRPRLPALTLARHAEGPAGEVDIFNTAFPFGFEVTSQAGIWHGLNGVRVRPLESTELGAVELELTLEHPATYLSQSRVAAAMVQGMPRSGVFRLRTDLDLVVAGIDIRLMLVDRFGTAWTSVDVEPLPNDPRERWYRWEDLRPLFLSNLRPGAQLRPEDVVSLHLSLRTRRLDVPVRVGLSFYEDPNDDAAAAYRAGR